MGRPISVAVHDNLIFGETSISHRSTNDEVATRVDVVHRTGEEANRAAIGCTENGQTLRVKAHSDLRSDELISYM